MKHSITLVFVAIISLTIISCSNNKSNNIQISQSSTFNRRLNKYSVETRLNISNRFGFSRHVSIWEDETNYKSDVDGLLKIQRAKADSVYKKYK